MNGRLLLWIALIAGLVAAVGYDVQLRRAADDNDRARTELAARVAAAEQAAMMLEREIATARAERDTIKARPATQEPSSVAATAAAPVPASQRKYGPPPPPGSAPRISAAVIGDHEDLRALSVRAYVGERRLLFSGLLRELGLTEPQLQRFDEIQAEYRHGLLDLAASMATQGFKDAGPLAPVQKQLTETRDAQLRELFGAMYGAWEEASRTQGARALVGQLLQQTFQTAGPVENTRIERLITATAKHLEYRRTAAGDNWDAIASEADAILSPAHAEAFKTAIAYRRLTERMNAMAAGKR